MIRINLLGRARPRVKRRVPITGALQLALFLVPVGLAILVLFGYYASLNRDIGQLQEQIRVKQQEKAQMAQLEQDIKEFEKKQALLKGRIDVIEKLKRSQEGPVQLLQAIGTTVSQTNTLWLTSMNEQAGDQIEFKGVAGSVAAVANFMTNLDRSGYFSNVEIKEAVQERPRGGKGAVSVTAFDFTLTAKFALPTPPEKQPEEAAAGTGAGGRS